MKIRISFVANSSSSSFTINKKDISPIQIYLIVNHAIVAKELRLDNYDYPWNITEDEYSIQGYTYMDNFDMVDYLEQIGIRNIVKWDYRGF